MWIGLNVLSFFGGHLISRTFEKVVTQICLLSHRVGERSWVLLLQYHNEVEHSFIFIINSTNSCTCSVWLLSICVSFLVYIHPVILATVKEEEMFQGDTVKLPMHAPCQFTPFQCKHLFLCNKPVLRPNTSRNYALKFLLFSSEGDLLNNKSWRNKDRNSKAVFS